VGIVRIKDLVLVNANTMFADENHRALGDILGKSLAPLFTQEAMEKYLSDLARSGFLRGYQFRAGLFAKREEGDTADTVGDEYDFYANIKGVNYGGAECYMFEILGKRLV
jgi:hypothetical protein